MFVPPVDDQPRRPNHMKDSYSAHAALTLMRSKRTRQSCRCSRNTPFTRHTLSGRRTTTTGRSPGLRVNVGRAAFSGPCNWSQWHMADDYPLTVAGAAAVLNRVPFESPFGEPVAMALLYCSAI